MNWEAIAEFFIKNIGYLYNNYSLYTAILIILIGSLIVAILALLKKPIKALTGKITNETLRVLANKSLILLAFGLSVALWYLLNWILPQYVSIDWILIFLTWALSQTAYALGDNLISKDKAAEIVEATKETSEKLKEDIKEDGKLDNSTDAIKEFWDKVK